MSKKWPETVLFADRKERRLRELKFQNRLPKGSPCDLLRRRDLGVIRSCRGVLTVGAAAVGFVALAFAMHWLNRNSRQVTLNLASGLSRFAVAEIVGSPAWTHDGGCLRPLRIGDHLDGHFQIIQEKRNRTTLITSDHGRIVVTGGATVDVVNVRLPADSPLNSRINFYVSSGDLGVEMLQGRSVVEIRVPHGIVIDGSSGAFTVSVNDTACVVNVSRGKLKVRSADGKKFAYLAAGQHFSVGWSGVWQPVTDVRSDCTPSD